MMISVAATPAAIPASAMGSASASNAGIDSDARVETGDLISARGHGRIRVLDMPGESRRGRTIVTLFRYGK